MKSERVTNINYPLNFGGKTKAERYGALKQTEVFSSSAHDLAFEFLWEC